MNSTSLPSAAPPGWHVVFLSVLVGVVVAANAPPSLAPWMGGGVALLLMSVIGWGRLIGGALDATLTIELQLLVGFAVCAHALALPAMVFGLSILLPAAFLPLGVVGFWYPRGTRRPESSMGLPLALALAMGFALIWSLESSLRFEEFWTGGRYRLWLDGFIHAGVIAEFGEARLAGRGSSALAEVASPLYHAVGHGIPALAMRLTGVSALALIPALWLPLGIALVAIGIFSLGRALGGMAGGTLALIFLAALPDAGAYGLRQGFLSFHWMLESSPGGLFALAVGCASLALLIRWIRAGGGGQLVLSALLLAATFLLRAHVFVWLLIPWLAGLVWAMPWPSRRWRVGLLALGALAAPPALLWVARAEIGQVGLVPFLTRFLLHLHEGYAPTAYEGVYRALTASLGPLGAAPVGLALALIGMGGIWLLTFLLGFAWAAWRRRLEAADILPLAMMGWAAMLMLFAPTPAHGDFTDFRQRGFIVIVAALLAWNARFALLALPRLADRVPLALLSIAALGSMTLWIDAAKQPRPAVIAPLREMAIRPGLVEAAAWIRRDAAPGESFLLAGQSPDAVWYDDATVLLGTSGIPAWISRPGLMRLSGPPRSVVVTERLAKAEAIQAEPEPARAFALLRAARIGFYLTLADAPPAWDWAIGRADFSAGEIRGWRVPP
jgi:hypothetical protein